MDVRIKAFQEATDTFAYLARLDVAGLKQKLGDERFVDGIQNGCAQRRRIGHVTDSPSRSSRDRCHSRSKAFGGANARF